MKGNHEDLMTDFLLKKGRYGKTGWLMNGGNTTLDSYEMNVPRSDAEWLDKLPLFIYEPEEKLLLSHTGNGRSVDEFNALWYRHIYESENPDKFPGPEDDDFRVFGHTTSQQAVVHSKWAMIDTGCAYADRGYGNLTAFIWPTGELYVQPNIEGK